METYSREKLQRMKGFYDEQIRLQFVDHVCETIRDGVLEAARKGLGEFVYDLYRRYGGIVPQNSLQDIQIKISAMFPDCDISSETITTLADPVYQHTFGKAKNTLTITWK